MTKFLDVGQSDSRTPLKHWLLNAELGRQVGVFIAKRKGGASNVHATANPFLVIDLCAGDGKGGETGQSSPSIITHHLVTGRSEGVDVRAVFIEKLPATFSELLKNTRDDLGYCTERLNIDARDWKLPKLGRHQSVFIHSDPNHIMDWPITPDLLGSLSETTTMLATLGCNVGGMKRLSIEQRMPWFDHVRECVTAMPRYHDAILVVLDRDSSQWAYLIRVPVAWSAKTIETVERYGPKYTRFPLRVASFRQSAESFRKLQDKLFLQEKERVV